MLERDYQPLVLNRIRDMFPGCWIFKNDSGYQQGIPDWTIYYKDMWAMLEIKRKPPKRDGDFEANQQWFLDEFNKMSFAACVFPENEEEVLYELQQAFASGRPSRLPERKQVPLGTLL